jgi:hypothetical protein
MHGPVWPGDVQGNQGRVNEGDIAKLALRDATDTFDRLVTQLVEAAEGDVDALYRAAISVTTPAAPLGRPKHIAFTYLVTAATEAKRRGSGGEARRG